MLCPGVQLSSSKSSFASLEEEKARATQKTRQLEQQLSQAVTKADEAAKRAQQAEASLRQLQAAVDSSKGDGKKDGNLQVGVPALCVRVCACVCERALAWVGGEGGERVRRVFGCFLEAPCRPPGCAGCSESGWASFR